MTGIVSGRCAQRLEMTAIISKRCAQRLEMTAIISKRYAQRLETTAIISERCAQRLEMTGIISERCAQRLEMTAIISGWWGSLAPLRFCTISRTNFSSLVSLKSASGLADRTERLRHTGHRRPRGNHRPP